MCMLPVGIMKVYFSLTSSTVKSLDQGYIENFTYQLTVFLSYTNSSGMFFIHTIYGRVFRIELIRLFIQLLTFILKQSRFHPQIIRMINTNLIQRP
jgi:hypothetical protein